MSQECYSVAKKEHLILHATNLHTALSKHFKHMDLEDSSWVWPPTLGRVSMSSNIMESMLKQCPGLGFIYLCI